MDRRDSKERLKKLESQVSQIYDVIHQWTKLKLRSPEPPSDVLDHFVGVYNTEIAIKPLPLFKIEGLCSRIQMCSQPLRRSFLALTLQFSSHPFFRGRDVECAELYASSAYADLVPIALEGPTDLDVVQSLCLLVLHDLKVLKTARAWGTIGLAARLEASFSWNRREVVDGFHSTENESSGCFWSVYILEKCFSAQCSILDRCVIQPRYPDNTSPSLLANTKEKIDRVSGITSSFLHAVSIWGDVMSYVHGIRCRKPERPWLPTSRYTELTQQMYVFEDQTALDHLFKNAGFLDQTVDTISENIKYWRPWILMQLTTHATSAVLSHPFIHIAGLRDMNHRQPPRLFMQSVIDQAQYHARWVSRLAQMCEALRFDVHDPLSGTLVAATATVAWVFRSAPDKAAASKADECFNICESFVKTAAMKWPHMERKVKLLEYLRGVSGQTRGSGDAVIAFQPSILWELLDNSLLPTTPNKSNSPNPNSNGKASADITLSVTTHILQPLHEGESQSASTATASSVAPTIPGDDACFDDFFSQHLFTEMNWSSDLEAQEQISWQTRGNAKGL
ncbi:hypothetical protein BU24DRAFT_452026 [Aaosphaeria arxii CBS 175.79]|uniref:Xylanolytic transcriptional activator regulatory domain-containing protein n=1 Tax=Aaosphaeria arxii CBS 175.79 TaxID=1450172 RepID=A0A6A5XR31_9PLEO|nr:uncharacterized protein BU24DRAFT_452026 [Aaosphaeria arxii CBS 175.79]KAF2015160.1 hypothetical protein BU24DRAFT_452026 [Aaosphaeria arxii CBS 175.79]